jgi:hypothetical protein
VTPSHTLLQELQLRASESAVCQLQLIVRALFARMNIIDLNGMKFLADLVIRIRYELCTAPR